MNLTYLWVVIGVLVPAFILCGRASRKLSKTTIVWLTLAIFTLSLVFDNIIVGLKIVAYDSHKILGLFVPFAPIEDFGYTIVGLILVPVLWNLFGKNGGTDD